MKSRKDHLVELAAAALGSVAEDVSRNAWDHVKYIMDSIDDASEPAQEAPRSPLAEALDSFGGLDGLIREAPARTALDAELFEALEFDGKNPDPEEQEMRDMLWNPAAGVDVEHETRSERALRAWYEDYKEHRRSDAAEATASEPVVLYGDPAVGPQPTPDPVRARLVKERDEACQATFGSDLQWYEGWGNDMLMEEAGCQISNRSRRAELALREYDDAVEAARTVSKIAAEASGQREYDERKALQSELGPDCIVYSVQDDPVTKAALELADMVARHYANCSDDRVPYNLPENFWRGLLAYRRAVRERDAKKEVKS